MKRIERSGTGSDDAPATPVRKNRDDREVGDLSPYESLHVREPAAQGRQWEYLALHQGACSGQPSHVGRGDRAHAEWIVYTNEMDPSLADVEHARDKAQQKFLRSLEDSITNQAFAAHLTALQPISLTRSSSDCLPEEDLPEGKALPEGLEEGGRSPDPLTKAARRRQHHMLARFVKSVKQRADPGSARAAARPLRKGGPAGVNPALERWQAWSLEDTTELMDLPSWLDQRKDHSSSEDSPGEFTGLGYQATISSFAKSRYWKRRRAHGFDVADDKTLTQRKLRRAQHTRREFGVDQDDEDLYLGFGAFDGSMARDNLQRFVKLSKRSSFRETDEAQRSVPRSKVISEERYSIIDSGTTVNVVPDGTTLLDNFDELAYVKIMGFNGSVSRSGGSGTIFGFSRSADGQRVIPLRLPNVHHVPGAPHDLLSVSALVLLGYEFHFTVERSYIVTPGGDELDLLQKRGLYWLKWRRAKASHHSPSSEGQPLVLQDDANGDRRRGNTPVAPGATLVRPVGENQSRSSVQDSRCTESQDSANFLADADLPDSNEPARIMFPSCFSGECESCNLGRVGSSSLPLSLLHRRCAHWNEDLLEKMVKHRAIDLSLTDRARCACDVCRVSKATRRHVAKERETLSDEDRPFQRVWTDLKGKVTKDFFGNQHIVTFTCEVTRWTCVYFAKSKKDVVKCYQEFLQWVTLRGFKVSRLQSDGGGEYTASENAQVISAFQQVSLANGIDQNFTSPYTPEMNGVSERLNRTIVEHTRALLLEAGLSREFWSLAAKHVVYVRNRLWHRALKTAVDVGASPYQSVYGKAPKLGNLRVWGCDAWKLDHLHRSSSFQRKAKKMIFVGLSPNRKGWVLFDSKTRTTSTTYHCTFDEDMGNRRCALRDFDLRQRKAGPGGSADDERLAVLERSLYDDDPVVGYEEPPEALDPRQRGEEAHWLPTEPPHGGNVDTRVPVARESSQSRRESVDEQPLRKQTGGDTGDRAPRSRNPPRERGGGVAAPGAAHRQDPPEARSVRDDRPPGGPHRDSRTDYRPNRQIGGSVEDGSADQVEIPQRRAAIGAPQDLDVEELDFLKMAMELGLPLVLQQRNPKQVRDGKPSSSRARYEKYKSAKTLRQIKQLSGTWEDIVWDYSRGYIDFSPTAASNANLVGLIDAWESRSIDSSPAAYVNSEGTVNTSSPFSCLSFEESIQQDYAAMAFEHIESMPHRAQRLLRRALGAQTLEQFARCCAARIMIPEPLSVREAMASEHAAEWKVAMQEEIDTLTKFGCFKQVSRSDAVRHGRLVKSKWVFKVKYEADGSLQRFKCRLVAKGFTQVEGSDFYDTFSPVFGYTSLRAIFAMSAARDFQLNQWDLKSSFIQQDLDVEHMYLETPDGFDKSLPDGQPSALHLLKSIYGLRQSSRLLHDRMSTFLIKLGFRQLISDRCIFVKGEGDDQVIICVWVDDIIMSSARGNAKAREYFDRDIRKEFDMSPWTTGEADWILNMSIKRDWDKGTLHLSLPRAVEKLAEKFDLTGREGRAPHVPMSPTLKLDKPADEEIVSAATWDYRSAVGGMLYLSITARPDIAQAVGVLSRFMSCPGVEHVEAAKQVIRYLYATKDFGVTYQRGQGNSPHKTFNPEVQAYVHTRKSDLARDDLSQDSHLLGTYCDADYAGDVGTRKSTGGYGMLMAGGLICWSSKLQPTVALSTAEAETMAGVEAVKQVMYLRLFLQELGFEQHAPSVVYEDNNAAISIAHGKEQSKRSKHYQVKVHFLNQSFQTGVFAYEKVPTKEMLADAFTKSLPRDDFCRYRSWMGMRDQPVIENT